MAQWVRFEKDGVAGFGTLDGETVAVHSGAMFAGAEETGAKLPLSEVALPPPCVPGKLAALWHNSRSPAENQGLRPEERRVGPECGRTWRARGSRYHKKKNKTN